MQMKEVKTNGHSCCLLYSETARSFLDSMESMASFLIHMAVKVNVWILLVAIESPPGPFFEVLTALGGGSEQSILCGKSVLINVFVDIISTPAAILQRGCIVAGDHCVLTLWPIW